MLHASLSRGKAYRTAAACGSAVRFSTATWRRLSGSCSSMQSRGFSYAPHCSLSPCQVQPYARRPLAVGIKRHFVANSNGINLIKVPKMGESITEGTIGEWKKSIGDIVQQDDLICVIETDKVSIDVHADVGGRIIMQAAEEGGTVYVGGDLVVLDTSAVSDVAVKEAADAAQKEEVPNPSAAPQRQHSMSYRIPSLKFPNRKKFASNSNSRDEIITPNKKAETRVTTGNVIRYEEGEIAAKYRPQPLSEEEISIVNSGGTTESLQKRAGKWKMVLQQTF